MAGKIDRDIDFLDTLIAWAYDIYRDSREIINEIDDPEIIILAKKCKQQAGQIAAECILYKPRLMHLKKNKPDSNGTGPGRNEPAANKLIQP